MFINYSVYKIVYKIQGITGNTGYIKSKKSFIIHYVQGTLGNIRELTQLSAVGFFIYQ